MPYDSVDQVPSYVPKAKRKQWMAVWNDSYSRHGDESRAFAEANAAIKKSQDDDEWDFTVNEFVERYIKPYE